ncbi:FkbM family methyltransferase [Pseudomonas sp. LTJR-52]|uniref:FkbM family methyltransferase n=1 Tax=Pseudomonas sp. LTJR-52 TaxID=2479392 RepID=UPI000EFA41C2|nr:FkbM family methyltransferase [Pseudomonas sp. LTJR-52]AYN94980.1 FkbM family methyltransferase [Pseudomonas sp. LTJR-52]
MKCTVIIPIGPGHQSLVQRAKNSVNSAIQNGIGAFDEVEILEFDDTQGFFGRSHARNEAVKLASESSSDWLFFLDADDLMVESAFQAVAALLDDYDAIWGEIYVADLATQQATRREHQVSPVTTLEQVLTNDPYLTLQMGHFVRTEVARQYPFDTELNSGEDFDYYLRVWKENRCIKINQPLFLNVRGEHSTGPRSATGADWRKSINYVFSRFCKENEVISSVTFNGNVVKFNISNPLDLIQNQLAKERFFEAQELSEMLLCMPKGARVLDIGSNIGNHGLFLTIIGSASYIECFEPIEETANILENNFKLNNIDINKYKIRRMGVGSQKGLANINRFDEGNLGASSIQVSTLGNIEVNSLDDLYPKESYDILKIDIEGMELEALRGGSNLIERCKPIIFIEVANENKGFFFAWMKKSGYRVHRAFELVNASNYIILPNKIRPEFYSNGLAAAIPWTPRVPLGPQQAPCGWSIADFFQGYFDKQRAIEIVKEEKEELVLFNPANRQTVTLRGGVKELPKKYPGNIILLGEILGSLSDSELIKLLDSLVSSGVREIVLFDIMDARWNNAFDLPSRFRDSEYYLIQANQRGYKLKNYLKLPHKAAFRVHDQLSNRITLLHFSR